MPGMLFLPASGTIRTLTRQAISPVHVLSQTGFREHADGMIWKGRRMNVFVTDRCPFLYSNHYFSFLYVLFLIRVRKRTKKKRALRQGAGFSVNRPSGINGNSAAYQLLDVCRTHANALDGSARKNPPYPRSMFSNGKTAIARDLPPYPRSPVVKCINRTGPTRIANVPGGDVLSIRVSVDNRHAIAGLAPSLPRERGPGREVCGAGRGWRCFRNLCSLRFSLWPVEAS